MKRAALVAVLALLCACSGQSRGPAGAGPSPAPVFFDPCPEPAAGGSDLPAVTLHCLGRGPKVTLSSLRGPLIVNVWGSWCGPCQEEVPVLQAFYAKAKGKVALLGVDYNDSKGSAQDFAGHIGMTYPSVVAEQDDIAGRGPFVIRGLPMTVFVDADGHVAYVARESFRALDRLEQLVREKLGVRL